MDSKLLESASKRSTNLGNGVAVVKASAWQQIGAWFVDFGVVAVVAGVAYVVVAGSEAGTTGLAVGAALATWWGAAWVYGFCSAQGRSFGALASGTGIVRFTTGTSPGFWRAGWVMFSRTVLFPIVGLVLVIAAVGGANPSMTEPKPRHITVDLRFPQLPG